MSKYYIIISFIVGFLLLTNKTNAQELIIKDFKHMPADIAARENKVMDVNDEPCAIIKINTGLKGLKFDGNWGIEQVDYNKPGQVWVWVPSDTRQLKVSKDGIPMKEYYFNKGLESLNVYSLTVVTNQSLAITIETPGVNAKVSLNYKEYDTNKLINDIEEGEYVIEISRRGYYPIIDTIAVSFENNSFQYRMQRTQKQMLTINTVPEGADLFFNDSLIGKTNHSSVHYADEYRLLIKKENYLQIDTVIILDSDLLSEYNFKLKKNTAVIHFNVLPENANILVNNVLIDDDKIELEAGVNHKLTVKAPQYATYTEEFSLERNSNEKKTVELVQMLGKVSLMAEPNGAKVELSNTDGSLYKWKGNKTVEVPEGTYKIKIEKKGYETKFQTVVVRNKETTTHSPQLSITGVDRGRAGMYSVVFPGWGQFHAHRTWAGVGFTASTLGLAAYTIALNAQAKQLDSKVQDAREAYMAETDYRDIENLGNDMQTAYNDYDKVATQRDQMLYLTMAVYFANIIDAVLFADFYDPSRRKKVNLSFYPTNKGAGLALSYKF